MALADDVRRLLDQLDVLWHPSDLDLLVFFARHPRSLLSSDQLAVFLGYGVKDIAGSLDLLLEVGLLTRTQTNRHAARMYAFATKRGGDDWLPALQRLASSREGRLALIWEIRRRSSGAGESAATGERDEPKTAALPFSPRRSEDAQRGPVAAPESMSGDPVKRRGHGGDR